ncbi:MAG: GtrA family protein [Saprospiraceae bacterium]|nr:GtrA family protein [Saprospiraceae bacterium]
MDFLIKFIKFGVVGATGVVVDFGATWVLKEWVMLNRYVASSIGFFCAVVSNYILNRIWTFQSHDHAVGIQFAKFFGVALVGLAINNALIYYFHEKQKIPFYASKAIATGIVVLWNFGANYLITFKA